MAIKSKFIIFDTLTNFLGTNGIEGTAPSTDYIGNVPKGSVVFIKDTGLIWFNGKYYGPNMINYLNNYYTKVQVDTKLDKKIDDYSKQYLTFTALESGTFTFTENALQYSLDNGTTWITLAKNSASPTVSAGNKILWKQTRLTPASYKGIGKFSATGNFEVSGNIMSLYYGDDFIGQKDLTLKDYAFYNLFNSNTKLISAENLILPATTLANYCYGSMFSGCTSLITVPELPAVTLIQNCYKSMFSGCTSLIAAPQLPAATLAESCYNGIFSGCTSLISVPELPATTLAPYCYRDMFSGCTSLTNVPELSAATLASYCYYQMFSGCTSLITAPELPATTLATGCYESMFYRCTALKTAPELPAITLTNNCYREMFFSCTSLTTAPETLPATTLTDQCYYWMFRNCPSLTAAPKLPATTLIENCYNYMFYGCTKLNYIECLATNISANDCTYNWLGMCSATGTFVTADNAPAWTTGTSGIPSGWNVYTESEYKEIRHYELGGTVSGQNYPVLLDSTTNKLYVNVPWTDNNTTSFAITANATDGLWDITGTNGTNAVTYAVGAYSSQQSKASFDTSSTAPTRSERLNYNGHLYATKLFSGGIEVLTSHLSLSNYYTKTESDNKYVYKSGDTMTGAIIMNTGTGIAMKYTSNQALTDGAQGDPWVYANGNPSYGIRYFEGEPDMMTLSAGGNNTSKLNADLAIRGDGVLYNRGSIIATQTWVSSLGYLTSQSLAGYLPLTGGTLTGHLKISGTKDLGSSWDKGIIAGADGHDKVVLTYLASGTNGAVIGAHNSNLSAWALLNVAGTQIVFRNNETERMRLDANGNFGIGTTSPGLKLHVNGGLLAITNNSGTLTLGAQNPSFYHFYGSDNRAFYFSNSSSFNGSISPYVNSSYDLGSSSYQWKTIYGNNLSFSKLIYKNDLRFIHDLASYIASGSTTGTICIKLPMTAPSHYDMPIIKIEIYEYSTYGASEIILGGHNWNTGKWYNATYSVNGNYDKGVRVARDSSNWLILLGTTTTTWNYVSVFISNVYTEYEPYKDDWIKDTTITRITDESSLLDISTPNLSYSVKSKFIKSGSSDSDVLLGGGGTKAISDFATAATTFVGYNFNDSIGGRNYFSKNTIAGSNTVSMTPSINGYTIYNSNSINRIQHLGFNGYVGNWTVTFEIKASAACSVNVNLCDTSASTEHGEQSTTSVTTEYVKHRYVFLNVDRYNTAENNGYNGFLDIENSDSRTIYVKDIKIEKGIIASDWFYAPEDLATQTWVSSLITNGNVLEVGGFKVNEYGFLYKYTHVTTVLPYHINYSNINDPGNYVNSIGLIISFNTSNAQWGSLFIKSSTGYLIIKQLGITGGLDIDNHLSGANNIWLSGYGDNDTSSVAILINGQSGHMGLSATVYCSIKDFTLTSGMAVRVASPSYTYYIENTYSKLHAGNYAMFGDLMPRLANTTYNLGSSTYKWNNLYLSNSLSDGTNSLTVANIKSTYDWYQTMITENPDGIINRWKEIENFVNGISDTSTLNGILLNYFTYRGGYLSTNIANSLPTQTELNDTNKLNGIYYVSYSGASGTLLNFVGTGSARYVLFYTTYNGGMLWRQSTDATYNAWRTILDSSNYTSYVYSKSDCDSRYLNANSSSSASGDTGFGLYNFRKDISIVATNNNEANSPENLQHMAQLRVMNASNVWSTTLGVRDSYGWIDCVGLGLGYGDLYIKPTETGSAIVGNYNGQRATFGKNSLTEKFIVFGNERIVGNSIVTGTLSVSDNATFDKNVTIKGSNISFPGIGEGFKIHTNVNYFGENQDGILFTVQDGNQAVGIDGGIAFRSEATNNGTVTATDWLIMRYAGSNYGTFTWLGKNILHAGNTYISNGVITINGTSITPVQTSNITNYYWGSLAISSTKNYLTIPTVRYMYFRNSSNNGNVGYIGRGGTMNIELMAYNDSWLIFGTNSTAVMKIYDSGIVGIGIEDSEELDLNSKLHINGLLSITNNGGTLRIGANNGSFYHFLASDSKSFYFSNSSTFNGNVYPYRNSAIDFGSSSYKWRTIYGDSVIATDYSATSDIRLKCDINQISDHIYSFRFKDSDKLHYGFIALELEKEHPDLVGLNEYKTVNYNSALSLYIAELENRVKILENEINNLKSK